MSKNILKGWRIYLSGPIEAAKDDGVGWRQVFIELNKKHEIGLKIIDPTNKGNAAIAEIGESRENLRQLKKNRAFEDVTATMNKIRRWDLRAVDESNIIVVNIDSDIPTVGTVDEVVRASNQDKPILAVVDGGPEECPDWYFPYIKYNEMFCNVEDLIDYLVKINEGRIGINHRWIKIESIK
jgi:hypothetical protein